MYSLDTWVIGLQVPKSGLITCLNIQLSQCEALAKIERGEVKRRMSIKKKILTKALSEDVVCSSGGEGSDGVEVSQERHPRKR